MTALTVWIFQYDHLRIEGEPWKVQVAADADVDDLKREIRIRMAHLKFHEARMALWKPQESLPMLNTATVLMKRLTANDGQLSAIAEKLLASEEIDSHVPRNSRVQPEVGVHFILQTWPVNAPDKSEASDGENDTISLLVGKYNRVVKAARDRKSPSVDSKLNNYIETQREEYAILDGRYHPAGPATAAPPIQIYHSVFADFLAAVDDDTDLEPALVEATGSLMRSASAICTTKKQRQHSTRQKLRDILEIGLNLNKSSADHILQYSMTGGIIDLAALGIVEEKFELGTGGDFTIQGGCSYQAYWVSEDHDNTRSACCCPSFIIGIAGPWIVIMGAVFTTQPIVQRLTDLVWLGTSPTLNDKNCYRIARVFRALKTCLETLSSYYQGLVPHEIIPDEPHPRFFPSTTSYRDITQKTVEFIYQGVLETDTACVVFLARTVTSTAIVVKFVQSYGEEAHTLLAEQGLAPKLLYCGDIGDGGAGYGGLKMVVMEYVNGQTAAQVFGTNKLSRDVTNDVNKAIGLLHQNGMVFGDLRRPNIMVIEDAEDHFRAKLIDFDWAGTAGQVHYPVHLSRHQHWADGVAPHQIIEKQHDLDMLQRLTSN